MPPTRWVVGMEYLYSAGRKHVDPRYCRTHARVARLFAESPSADFNAEAWSYIAEAWNELANFKERIAQAPRPKLPADGLDETIHSAEEQPHQL